MHTQYIQPVNPNQFVNTSNGSRMPFTPQLTVSPNMQPYVQAIGALLIDNIQNGANTSVIRQALYHHMAQNGFYNKEFTDLLQFAVEYAEVLEYMDRLDGRTAQIKSVEEVTQIAAAAEVTLDTTHRLWNAMPPEMQQHVQSWLQYAPSVMNRTDQMRQQQRYQQQAAQPYGAPMASYNTGGGYPQPQPQQPYYQPGGINRNQSTMANRAIEQMAAAPTRTFNQPTINELRAGGTRSSVVEAAVPTTTAAPAAPLAPADGYHQQLRSDYGDEKPLPEGIHPGVFCMSTAVAFFAFKGGVASNFIIDKDQCTMRYSDHRNEKLLRGRSDTVRRFTPDYPAADAVFEAMVKQQLVSDMLADLEKRQADATVTGDVNMVVDVIVPCLVNLNNSTDYHSVASMAMEELGLAVSIEDSTITYTGIDFRHKPYNDDVANLETEMRNVRSHEDLRKCLVLMRDKMAPLYYWEQLDVAITQHVNELMQTMLGVEARMDCYTEEIGEMLDMIHDDYPDTMERFNTTLLRRLQVATLDNDSTHLWRSVYECVDGDGITSQAMTIVEDITLLPITSTDIDFGCMGDVGVVTAKATPNLYRAARHRIDNAHPKTRWIKFITLDRIVIYVYPTSDGGVLIANKPFV